MLTVANDLSALADQNQICESKQRQQPSSVHDCTVDAFYNVATVPDRVEGMPVFCPDALFQLRQFSGRRSCFFLVTSGVLSTFWSQVILVF